MTRGVGDCGAEGPAQRGSSDVAEELAYLAAQADLDALVQAYLKLCAYRPPPPLRPMDWGFDIECC
jgi:hypothetical protein